jgi:hypothetical protein
MMAQRQLAIYNCFYSLTRIKIWYVIIQRQITNHKNNNLHVVVGCTWVFPEIIIKFRHLKYRRCTKHTHTQQRGATILCQTESSMNRPAALPN